MNLKKIADGNRDKKWAFLMIRFDMPEFIKQIQERIPQESLYIDESDNINGYGLEIDSHVTLFPCLDNETSVNEVSQYLPDVSTLGIELVNISLFENDDYCVLKADVNTDSSLAKLNSELLKHFVCGSEFKDYHPHMTIAYIKKDDPIAKELCKEFDKPVLCNPQDYDFSWSKDGEYKHIYFNV